MNQHLTTARDSTSEERETQPPAEAQPPRDEAAPHATDVEAGADPWEPFPEIDLRQLIRMTDDTGMYQHAVHGVPDPNHGYCIDDNARALIAALLHAQLHGHDERVVPLTRYLGFLTYAYNEETGRFRNFMGYDRHWLEAEGSKDSQARTLWALGLTIDLAPKSDVRELAQNVFLRALPAVDDFAYIRSWAFTLIGLDRFLAFDPEHRQCRDLRAKLAGQLFDRWRAESSDAWPWWDEMVTYDNAKLCQALILSGVGLQRQDMVDAGLTAVRWLLEQQTVTDNHGQTHLSIIGNAGWLRRGQARAVFDQQPLEAYALADACLCAARIVGDPAEARAWADRAWWCYEWFIGRNDLGVSLYHADTGGCQDGLQPHGANKNQGAESILAYLLTVLELHRYRRETLERSTQSFATHEDAMRMPSERAWVAGLIPRIEAGLRERLPDSAGIHISEQHRLPYTHAIDHYQGHEDRPVPSPTRNYATDILVREVRGDRWTPRVVIEAKLGQVTTHDALTYSAKAATHKQIHPYLRYGILIGAWGKTALPPRLLHHGEHFDFMMCWPELEPDSELWDTWLAVLAAEVVASRQTQKLLTRGGDPGQATYRLIHRQLRLE